MSSGLLSRTCLALSLAGALLPSAARAQEGEEKPAELFFESVDVHVANIEVTVTDAEGKPVTGLTRGDFAVLEDGQPVKLTNFFAVEERAVIDESSASAAGPSPEIAEDSLSEGVALGSAAGPETRNLFLVVYIDNLNIEPQSRNRSFASLRNFLHDRLGPNDRVMIVAFDGGLEIAQKFTNDRGRIEETLSRLEKETGRTVDRSARERHIQQQIQRTRLVPRPQNEGDDVAEFEAVQLIATGLLFDIRTYVDTAYREVEATVAALERFAGSLAGLPGRKAILYLSDGVSSRTGEALVQGWHNKFATWASNSGARSLEAAVATVQTMPRDTLPLFRRLVDSASAQRVAFYPLSNPRRQGAGQVTAEFTSAGTSDGLGAFSPDILAIEAFNREAPLLLMAEGTGGVAFTRSSNMAELLDRMTADFSTFYSLGYTPLSPGDGKFHEVEVTVNRPGLVVRHVKGYREVEPAEQMRNLTLSALFYDFADNPLAVSLAAGQYNETTGGQFRIPLMIKVPFEKLVLLPQKDLWAGRLMAYVVVQDEKGNLSPFKRVLIPLRVPDSQYDKAMQSQAAYTLDLVMKKGKHRIAVGIRDELAHVEATVNLDLSVGLGLGS